MSYQERPAFGEYLRELRERRGLARSAAAAELEITASYLRRLEVGHPGTGAPSDALIHRLARLYGVESDQLFALAGRVPDDLRELFETDPAFIATVRAALKYWTAPGAYTDLADRLKQQ